MNRPPRPTRRGRVQIGRISFIRQGLSRFDLTDPYSVAIGLNWGGFALLFVTLEVTINACFGALYWARPGCVANLPPGSFLNAFFFSVETLATVGYGVMAPVTPYGHVISGIEIVSGTAFTAIMTGLTFVRFSRPRARVLYADNAVVAMHNGLPTLMVRVANGRSSMMTDAFAQLTVLMAEQTLEGQSIRRTHDLSLIRAHLPLFAITWLVMHPIAPGSPLHGRTMEQLRAIGARLFFTIQAWDTKLGIEIRDLHDYKADEIQQGMRFVDVVKFDPVGIPVANFTRISEIEVDASWPPQDEPA